MSDKSSSEERGNNYSVDPVIAAAFLEIYQQLDQLKKDLIFEKSGREILEKYVDRLLEVSDRHIIELEVLRKRLDVLMGPEREPTKEGLSGRGQFWKGR